MKNSFICAVVCIASLVTQYNLNADNRLEERGSGAGSSAILAQQTQQVRDSDCCLKSNRFSPACFNRSNQEIFSQKSSGEEDEWVGKLAEAMAAFVLIEESTEGLQINHEEQETIESEDDFDQETMSVGSGLEESLETPKFVKTLPSHSAVLMEDGHLFPSPGGASHNGRWYTRHALERMAPETPEIIEMLQKRALHQARIRGLEVDTALLESWKKQSVDFQDWWRECRPQPRGVLPSLVEEEIAHPGTTGLSVIISEEGDVITVIRRDKVRTVSSRIPREKKSKTSKKSRNASSRLPTSMEEEDSLNQLKGFLENKNPQECEEEISILPEDAFQDATIKNFKRYKPPLLPSFQSDNIENFKRYKAALLPSEDRLQSFARNFTTRFRQDQHIRFNQRTLRIAQAVQTIERNNARDAKAKVAQMNMDSSYAFGWVNEEWRRTQELRKIKEAAVRPILASNSRAKSAELFERALQKMKKKAISIHKSLGRISGGLRVKRKKAAAKEVNPKKILLQLQKNEKRYLFPQSTTKKPVKAKQPPKQPPKKLTKAQKKANKKAAKQADAQVPQTALPQKKFKNQVPKAPKK